MESLIMLLIYLVVIFLVLYLVFWIVGQMGLPQPVRMIIMGIIGLIAIVWLLQHLGMF